MGINANITNEANVDYQYNTYADAILDLGIFQSGDIIFVNETTGIWLLGTQKQAGAYLFNGVSLEYVSQSLKDQIVSVQSALVDKENVSNKVTTIVGNETNSTLYASLVSILNYFSSTKVKELALTPLGFGEFWQSNLFVGGTPTGNLTGTAISGGSLGGIYAGEGATNSYYPNGVVVASSTTANSGYRIQTPNLASNYFGKKSKVNQIVFMLPTAVLTTRQVKGGFLNQILNITTQTNACYWQIDNNILSFRSAKAGGVSVVSPTTFTLTRGVQYLAQIEVDDLGTVATLTIYTALSPTVAVHTDVINTANALPNLTSTTFGEMVIATNTATATAFLIFIYVFNRGTKQGFLKNG